MTLQGRDATGAEEDGGGGAENLTALVEQDAMGIKGPLSLFLYHGGQ